MKTLASLGTSKIAWPNVVLPLQTTLYYAVNFLPSTTEPEFHGGDHEKGTYQVSVFVPAGTGIGPALVAAQAVADHFKRQNLSGVSCGVPTLTPPIQEPDWWHVPVRIPFVVL
jgi:hypothetical protein